MKQLLTIALLSVIFIGCEKDDDKPSNANGVDFTSLRKFDIESNFQGTEGDATDDYTHEDWPQWVYDIFKPLDTVSLQGYIKSPISIDALFPNPCADTQIMRLFATQPINLKVAIVDINKNVLLRNSYHVFSAIHFIGFDYKELNMKPKTYYRMFYAFSAEGMPYFSRGHIDIYKKE
jgi:hypothetical protein